MGRLFGTDGIRGVANTSLTCELALGVGRATALILTDASRRRPLFVIGADTRISSNMLMTSLTAGLCSVGADVIILGTVPTPAVAFLIRKYSADAGIMISASHNPAEFNGIKIFNSDGFKLSDELEEQIEEIVLDHISSFPTPTGINVGKVRIESTASKYYIDHIKSTVFNSLEGLNIAVDCANGSASTTAKKLFLDLRANATILFDRPDGVNINLNCGSTHIEALAKYVVENKLDAGIAFDGDADRCLCVDEKGNMVDGDFIMAICALDLQKRGKLPHNTVVGTIMTNYGFEKFCENNNLRFEATKVGDRYVLEEMLLKEYGFGGEQSGHIIFRDFATTGDGQLTAVQLLSHMKRENKKLSELAAVMERYPQVIINLTVSAEGKLAFHTDNEVKAAVEKAKKELEGNGRIVVRPSGTEPLIRVMTEGKDKDLIEKIAKETAAVLQKRLGKK